MNFQNNSPYDFEYNYDYDLDNGFNRNDEQMLCICKAISCILDSLYVVGFVCNDFSLCRLPFQRRDFFVSLIRGKQFSFSEGLKDVFG